jgi:hypothetical protein
LTQNAAFELPSDGKGDEVVLLGVDANVLEREEEDKITGKEGEDEREARRKGRNKKVVL